jgi:hypothetical protein
VWRRGIDGAIHDKFHDKFCVLVRTTICFTICLCISPDLGGYQGNKNGLDGIHFFFPPPDMFHGMFVAGMFHDMFLY